MPSAIDATVPPFGNALTSAERANWATAKSEITALQSGKADLNSPGFTGTPTAPTAAGASNDTTVATTAFVKAAVVGGTAGVGSFNSRTGAVTLTAADVTGAGGAPLASPALTGTPTAPTPTAGDNSTKIATTAFVAGAGIPAASAVNPQMDGAVAVGTSLAYARADHRHATDTSRAPVASPSFTGNVVAGGSLYVTTSFLIDPANGWEWSFYRSASDGNHYQVHRSGHYDYWNSSNGTRAWVAGNTQVMSLDGSGNLNANGNIASGGAVTTGGSGGFNLTASGGYFSADASNAYLRFAGAWGLTWSRSTGHLYYLNGSGVSLLEINEAGQGVLYPQVTGGGNAFAFGWDGYGVTSFINSGNYGYLIRSTSGGGLTGTWEIALNGGASQVYAYYGTGTVVAWTYSPSDARLKTNIGEPTLDALAAINALKVREFDMKVPIPGAVEQHWPFGLIAHEVGEVIPVAYAQADRPEAYDMIRELPLIATLVRAVQQLTARVAELEARLGAANAT